MVILFICGSLEPGKDGVGDYTRRLAGALIQRGQGCTIVSINDAYVSTTTEGHQQEDGIEIPSIRLPASNTLKSRFTTLQSIIQQHRPEWVSLQYVLYAFHLKGLPFYWMHRFKKLSPHSRWHINMHELWIGNKKEESLKDKLLGRIQRYIVKTTIRSIQPAWLSTSIEFYRQMLSAIHYKADVQPIFSNMPVGNIANNRLYNQLPEIVRKSRNKFLLAVLFGSINPYEGLAQNLQKMKEKAANDGKQLTIVHVGRSPNIDSLLTYLQTNLDCLCIGLGAQAPEDIAALFKQADIGLSSYGEAFLGKSGSVAAMLNNGLPVVLLRRFQVASPEKYPYARFIDEVDSLKKFIDQPRNFAELYGLQDTQQLYLRHFLN